MYGLYSRAASNQERPMMARVRYLFFFSLFKKQFDWFKIHEEIRENLGIVILKLVVGTCEHLTLIFQGMKYIIIKSRSWRRMSLILSMVVRIRAYS